MDDRDGDRNLLAISALADPLRRALYRFVARHDEPVSRDRAAEAVGVARSAAVFHLDRLVEEGLLTVEFRRLSGRGGPGAGRPAKLYRRAAQEFAVALPPRGYDLAADLLACAVARSAAGGEDVRMALRSVAGERGRALAVRCPNPRGRPVEAISEVLAECGYEPCTTPDGIRLRNCPFHRLVDAHRELVCSMNFALLEGLVGGLQVTELEPVADPQPGHCCVRIAKTKED